MLDFMSAYEFCVSKVEETCRTEVNISFLFSAVIGPVLVTTDPDKFQANLRDLYVQGGG